MGDRGLIICKKTKFRLYWPQFQQNTDYAFCFQAGVHTSSLARSERDMMIILQREIIPYSVFVWREYLV